MDRKSKVDKIDDLIEDIYNLRKEGMEEDGEYSIKNLIFKEFRNLDYLDNLKELRKKEISKELSLENLNNDNQLTEDVGDVLENQKESYLISSGNYVLVASIKNKKLIPSWVTSQSITKYNQIRFLSEDDAQKFNDKYNLEGNVGKARSSYDLIEINLDPTIKTYINKAWFSKIGSNALELAGLKDVKLYSEDTLNKIKEIFNIFDSKKTIFNLVYIYIPDIKDVTRFKNISELERNKYKITSVKWIGLKFKAILKNFILDLYVYVNNEDDKLDTINNVELYFSLIDNFILKSKEDIENKTASITNLSTLISIGDFLFDNIEKDIDYDKKIEILKGLGVKSLDSIKYVSHRIWFYFKDFLFFIDFEDKSWRIAPLIKYGYLDFDFSIDNKYVKSNSIELFLLDKNLENDLKKKVKNKQIEMEKELKNTTISNLNGFLDKMASYWIKEDNDINKDKINKHLNSYLFDIGQNLIDLAEANEKLKNELMENLSLTLLKEELIDYSNEDEIEYKTKEIMDAISKELKNPFVKYISLDWLSYGDLIKGYDYRDLVKLVVPYIVFNDTDYNVYFTDKLGWEGDKDYIVTRKETTLKNLYKVFKRDWEEQEETLSKEEFEDHVFTIDENGNYINVKID